jgi:CubicO group peptidase (beta-lactamase class C family)
MTAMTAGTPQELGVDAAKLDALLARARKEVDEGLLPSCQLALARHGRLVAFAAYGDADLDTRYVIFSATKPLVASAVWQLMAAGSLDIERRVADYIPEFGTNGKDVVTVEQVMLHTSGFPHAPLGPPKWFERGQRLAQFGQWRLNWEPGTAFEYHATSAHWVLAELIERISGRDYRDFVHERVTAPLGLPRILGIPPDQHDGIADLQVRGEPATPDELEQAFGVREMPITEVTDEALMEFNRSDIRALGVPGGGGIATAATVALFYQGLLHNRAPGSGGADPVWDPEILADATGRVRNSFPDPLTGTPVNRGLGVIIAGGDGRATFRGFGHTQSPRTFGHNGAAGQVAWADPESGLTFCYLTNGDDRHVIRQARRSIGLSSRAAVCAT